MNNVVLIGRLTRDPELSYTANNQTAVTRFTLAVDRPYSQDRERQADFIRIVVFGKQAENVNRYLTKGSQCAVEGRIQTGSYQNREGATVYTTDIIANRVEFLGRSNGGQGANASAGTGAGAGSGFDQGAGAQTNPAFEEASIPDSFQAAEDDLPF